MTVVVGIRFKDSGKTYYFDPGDLALHQGDIVIVETVRGPEMAKVAYERRDVPESELVGELKPVVRHAEPADFERMKLLQARHDEVMARCAEKVREHNLPMNLVKAEYSFDGSRLTFYFTSEKRVDFRMLVRDLARTFRSRIELRQIGPRDEAKLLGGIGPCGRLLCCATFLPDYARVSIKMAKDQDLPLNPSKISGVCGRLLCCLSYEHEQYVELRAELPRKGTWVQTPDGPGEVVGVNVLQQTVMVQLSSSGMIESYSATQIREATEHVHAVARSRTEEGITPAARREGSDLEAYLQEEGLDDELYGNAGRSEVLDTLAWLEEGASHYEGQHTDDPSAQLNAREAGRSNAQSANPGPRSHPANMPDEPPRKQKRSRSRRPRKRSTDPQKAAPDARPAQDASKPARSEASQGPSKSSRRRKRRGRGGSNREQSKDDGG